MIPICVPHRKVLECSRGFKIIGRYHTIKETFVLLKNRIMAKYERKLSKSLYFNFNKNFLAQLTNVFLREQGIKTNIIVNGVDLSLLISVK